MPTERREKKRPLGAEELSVFCLQLSLMLHAGIGSEESVGILAGDARTPEEKNLLTGVHQALTEGESLSRALEGAGVFPGYMLRMVEIGQVSGRLEQVLSALSDYYRREADTRQSLRRAIAYPAVMAALIAAVFLVLVSRVLPVFRQVLGQLGMSLSPAARGLLALGSAGRWAAWAVGAALLLCAACALWLCRTARGRAALARLLGRTAPARAVDRGRFASAMALMLSSGLPLDEAMDRCCALLRAGGLSPALERCREEMERGTPFPAAAEACGIFSGLQAGILSAGFRTGVSERAMEELAVRCQEEADETLSALLGRFEYGLIAVLCAAVGLVLLSVMLPLMGALSAIGG